MLAGGDPRLLPLPRRARRAVGRARRHRLHGRARRRCRPRPQRAAAAALRRRRRTAWSPAPPRRAPSRSRTAAPSAAGKLGPGQMLAVDPARGVEEGAGDQAPARRPAPLRACWPRGFAPSRREAPSSRPPRTLDASPGRRRLHARGALARSSVPIGDERARARPRRWATTRRCPAGGARAAALRATSASASRR